MLATSTSTVTGHHSEEHRCSTCFAIFTNKDTKRVHMKDDWHVYNLQRRIISLPPISKSIFQSQILGGDIKEDHAQAIVISPKGSLSRSIHVKSRTRHHDYLASTPKQHFSNQESSPIEAVLSQGRNEESLTSGSVAFSPMQCLFCNLQSASLHTNLGHMSYTHSFFIPDANYLIDESSLLNYLSFVISSLNECLYCGCVKGTKFAIQDHMSSKSHCRVDFESEQHQLWQFYDSKGTMENSDEELGDTEDVVVLVPDEEELRLPSGKILGRRSQRSTISNHLPSLCSRTEKQLTTRVDVGVEAIRSSIDRRVANRASSSTGMIGVPEFQQRSLVATEKGIEKLASRVRNEYSAKLERAGNKQKRFRVLTMGKKAGGLEKRNG